MILRYDNKPSSFGLHGIDKLYSFMIKKEFENIILILNKNDKIFKDYFNLNIK